MVNVLSMVHKFMWFFCLLVTTGMVQAQEEEQFQAWMQEVNQTNGRLKLNIEGNYGDDAVADTVKLQELFGKMATFFEQKSSDAADYALSAMGGYKRVGELISTGDSEQAMAIYYETRANCSNCHAAHRGRTSAGAYKIIY